MGTHTMQAQGLTASMPDENSYAYYPILGLIPHQMLYANPRMLAQAGHTNTEYQSQCELELSNCSDKI